MVIDLLREARGLGDALALVGTHRSWTYAALDGDVAERAEELRAQGVEAGRIVPVPVAPTPEDIIHLLALWRVGVTPAPLSSKLTPSEREAAEAALVGEPSDAQAVLWTSGTAGRPRGVALTYENLAASATAARERLLLGPDDVWLASLSPAHVGGLALVTRALLLGSSLVAVGSFDAGRTLIHIDGDGGYPPVTHLSVVPTQLLRLLELRGGRRPPSTFRCALVGGARAPSSLLRTALDAGWPLAVTYGLTEASSQVATAPPELTLRKPGTVGEPLDGIEVRVSEQEEILVRGATVASGYVGASDEPLVTTDGWLHTGDLGRVDDEGHLWITGRRSDRIVTGGVTVDAVEVEEAVRSYDTVTDVCVVGLPDPHWGERVAAWVVPADDGVDADALRDYLRQRLSGPKLPRVFHVSAEGLPRNANGKVDRNAVRAVLEGVAT